MRRGKRNPGESNSALEREYYFYQQLITDYNTRCLEIKKWSVSTASALVVVGQISATSRVLLFSAIAVMSLAFWITETQSRVSQRAFIRRVLQMESVGGPQVSNSWQRFTFGLEGYNHLNSDQNKRWDKPDGENSVGAIIGHFFSPRTSLPHAFIALLAVSMLFGHLTKLFYLETPAADNATKIEISHTHPAG